MLSLTIKSVVPVIAGAVVGVILLAAGVVAIFWFIKRRRTDKVAIFSQVCAMETG
jgi:uncharacterized protein (DUF2062 family)